MGLVKMGQLKWKRPQGLLTKRIMRATQALSKEAISAANKQKVKEASNQMMR